MAFTSWNPSDSGNVTLSNGNLTATGQNTASWVKAVDAQLAAGGGKFYWEYTMPVWTATYSGVGFCPSSQSISTITSLVNVCGVYQNGHFVLNGANVVSLPAGFNGAVVCIAVDLTAQLAWARMGPTGLWNASATANPATRRRRHLLHRRLKQRHQALRHAGRGQANDSAIANFGASAFAGAVPAGFNAGFPPTVLPTRTYTQWNPLDRSSTVALSNGNLTAGPGGGTVRAMDKQVSGKFYWECQYGTTGPGSIGGVGVWGATVPLGTFSSTGYYGLVSLNGNGTIYVDGTIAANTLFGAIPASSLICIAYDFDKRQVWFRVGAAGLWNMSAGADPGAGVGGYTGTLGNGLPGYPGAEMSNSNEVITANFGASAFAGVVPSGFTAGFLGNATPPNYVMTTHAAIEEWGPAAPSAVVLTQIGVEEWVPYIPSGGASTRRVMVMA